MAPLETRDRRYFWTVSVLALLLLGVAAYGVARDDGWRVLVAALAGLCVCVLAAVRRAGDWFSGRRRGLLFLAALGVAGSLVLVGIGLHHVWPAPRNAGWAAPGESQHVLVGSTVVGVDTRGPGSRLVGHRAGDGAVLWQHRIPDLGGDGTRTVYVAGDRILVVGYAGTAAFGADGEPTWSAPTSGVPTVVSGTTVLYSTPARALDLATGRERWAHDALEDAGTAYDAVAIYDPPVAVPESPVAVATVGGRTSLVRLAVEDGTRSETEDGPSSGRVLVVDGGVVRTEQDSEVDVGSARLTGEVRSGAWRRVVPDVVDRTQVGLAEGLLRVEVRRGGRDGFVLLDPRDGEVRTTRPVPDGWEIPGEQTHEGFDTADDAWLLLHRDGGGSALWRPATDVLVPLEGQTLEAPVASAGDHAGVCTDAGFEIVGPERYVEGPFREDGCGAVADGVATVGDRVVVLPD